ncbi:MAG: pyruvate kinase [Rikenellaceae bacterium]
MERRTKIVATISDRRCEVSFIRDLFEAGMNVVRINSAHVTPESALEVVKNVREVSDKIAILIDTKGPEIRTTKTEVDGGYSVDKGQQLTVKGCDDGTYTTENIIYVNYKNIVQDVPVDSSLLIDDGDIELKVIDKNNDELIVEVMNKGVIKSSKSLNIPNVSITLPSITERDEVFIKWAIENKLDFIAHSFVRRKEDVLAVQDIIDSMNSEIKIISKIENQEGVDNIEEILEYTYGVMVARGDLGIEIPGEQIPIIQRSLVRKCVENKKPVIIATQMLQSMITNPRPTRAEISDIANAIYQRTDAIMLSGETANGAYALEAVQTMDRVAKEIEKDTVTIVDVNLVRINNEITAQLSRSAVRASLNLPVKAIVIDTLTGRTARYLSAYRGAKTVYTVCYRKRTMRELALSYGIYPAHQEPSSSHCNFLFDSLSELEKQNKLDKEDIVVVVGGNFGSDSGASFMEISTVLNLEQKYYFQNRK